MTTKTPLVAALAFSWVLWMEHLPLERGANTWEPQSGHETFAHCQTELRSTIDRITNSTLKSSTLRFDVEGDMVWRSRYDKDFAKRGIDPWMPTAVMIYKCFPAATDPRGRP
jgi:hypothetical protein